MKMKAVEGLALFATAVMVFIVLAAIVSDDSRTDGQSVPPLLLQGGGSPQGLTVAMPGAGGGSVQQNLWAGSLPQAIPVATPKGNAVDLPVPQPGGVFNFEQAPKIQFYGKIQQITEVVQNDGQMHVWIHDPAGGEMQISVAPNWFLKLVGCSLGHDGIISGMGFRFDRKNKDALVYAKKIQINGHVCHLRNDEGFALWSNKLR